jgi:predicted regulator of Ras-like GTPase activity (Roadblock/LC7/MglB family)
LIEGLAQRPEVAGLAVISPDGLIIEHALAPDTDSDALAALATGLLRHAGELGAAGGLGGLEVAVLDFASGPAVATTLADGASLILLARPDADLGELLYLLRRNRGAIAALL